MPLGTNNIKAKEMKIPVRYYRPEKGESWVDVGKRCKEFINNVSNKYIFFAPNTKEDIKRKDLEETKADSKKVLCVTHGGFIGEFIHLYAMISGADISNITIPKNTSIYIFRVECANCLGVCYKYNKFHKIAMKLIKENVKILMNKF